MIQTSKGRVVIVDGFILLAASELKVLHDDFKALDFQASMTIRQRVRRVSQCLLREPLPELLSSVCAGLFDFHQRDCTCGNGIVAFCIVDSLLHGVGIISERLKLRHLIFVKAHFL